MSSSRHCQPIASRALASFNGAEMAPLQTAAVTNAFGEECHSTASDWQRIQTATSEVSIRQFSTK